MSYWEKDRGGDPPHAFGWGGMGDLVQCPAGEGIQIGLGNPKDPQRYALVKAKDLRERNHFDLLGGKEG